MKLFLLSKENILLARAEAEALLGRGKLEDNILLIKTKNTTTRLAQTKFIGELLFEATSKTIETKIKKYDWNKLIKGTFATKVIENKNISQSLSRTYGGLIYDILKRPKVSLENPGTSIVIVKTRKKFYVCTKEWKNEEKFVFRNPKTWPAQLPITLNPKLARTCVNLTGSRSEIYDPFCGIGGFLIEAGLMGISIIGSDISKTAVDYCVKNLKHHKIRKYYVSVHDFLKTKKKYNYIVTDVPYGKNTKDVTKTFYSDFINILVKTLKKRAVIVFPHFAHAKSLLKKSKLKIKGEYSVYIHSSLTREIFVLEK